MNVKIHDKRSLSWKPLPPLIGYGLAIVVTALSAVARWLFPAALTPAPYLGFYPAVVVSAIMGGVGPGLVSTFASLLLVNFVFGRFNIHDHGAVARQVIWMIASTGVCLLAGMQRTARLRERRQTENLFRLNDELEARIEERKRSEEALKDSEEQFRALADSIPNLAWRANGDGYITWYNQRWYEYTGTTPEQMEGWGWQSVHDPVELPRVLERWQASIATGEPFEMTFPLRGVDGVFRPFLTRVFPLKDATGHVLQWFGTNTDVSELMRAEESLARIHNQTEADRRRLEAILETIPVGVVLIEAGTNRFSLINRRAAEIYGADYDGVDLEDHIARVKLLQPDGTPFPWEDLPVSHTWRGEEVHNVEMTIEGANGVRVPLLVNTAPLRDTEGNVIMAVVVFDDITERKQVEQKIARQVEELCIMNEDLTRFNKALASRELRMIELKKEINELCAQISQQPRYPLEFEKT